MPMKNPPHPGDFIWTEIVEPAGLSVTAAVVALGVSRLTDNSATSAQLVFCEAAWCTLAESGRSKMEIPGSLEDRPGASTLARK
ncbi:MAG TPA: hypothetical protein VMV34_00355 [Terriglobia bacterium]|nr:hypothetical protein [Terriglobia bacterium]